MRLGGELVLEEANFRLATTFSSKKHSLSMGGPFSFHMRANSEQQTLKNHFLFDPLESLFGIRGIFIDPSSGEGFRQRLEKKNFTLG